MRSIFSFLILLLANTSYASAPEPGQFRYAFGPYFYRSIIDSTQFKEVDSVKTGMALNVEGGMPNDSSIELQFLYFEKRYFNDSDLGYMYSASPRVYITLGYRKWLFDQASVALGLASHYLVGAEKVISSGGDSSGLELSSAKESSYSGDFSLQLEIFSTKKSAFVFDYRYSYLLFHKEGEESNHSAVMLLFRGVVP